MLGIVSTVHYVYMSLKANKYQIRCMELIQVCMTRATAGTVANSCDLSMRSQKIKIE